MLRRWYSIVFGLRKVAAAASRVVLPSASNRAIWNSWGVSCTRVVTSPDAPSRRWPRAPRLPGRPTPRLQAERLHRPHPVEAHAQLGAQVGRLRRVPPARLLAHLTALEPRQTGEQAAEFGALTRFAGEPDRLVVTRLGSCPLIRGGLIAGDRIQQVGQEPDGRALPDHPLGPADQLPTGVRLADPERRHDRPQQQPRLVRQLVEPIENL